MTPLVIYSLILAFSAGMFAWVVTWALVLILPRLSVIDVPNERSNHAAPVPRGGGIAVMICALFFLLVSGIDAYLATALLLAAGISFADDWKGQPVRRRLIVHVVASLLAVSAIEQPVFQGFLPFLLDHALAALLLTYFLNIYNFMDGIDEITSMQTTCLCAGLVGMVVAVPHLPPFIAVDAVVIAGSVAGFWYFNRHPARIFLGDVGSVPLGLFMGFLLLMLASQGQWAAALILPAYYLTDASVTLIARLLRGAPLHQSHSEHAYQQAVRRGKSHRDVVRSILTLNLVLLGLALLSSLNPWLGAGCVILAYAASGALTLLLKGITGGPASRLAAGHA